MSLTWKMRRLRAMSAQELMFRAQRYGRVFGERLRPPLHAPAPSRYLSRTLQLLAWDSMPAADPYVAAATQIMNGRWRVLGLDAADIGWPPHWNRDPKTGIQPPRGFGKTFDYRDPALVGNIKYLWELNRHAELTTLAQAFRLTGRDEYAAACRLLINSWIEQCPSAEGANWSSSLELAIRLVNWALTWDLLGVEPSSQPARAPMLVDAEAFKERWLASVFQHCRFIDSHLSLYSSANNHLLGELMGLYVASVCWPCWHESPQWRDAALAQFEEEALKQNAPDGVNREQAIYYQHEVADMMLLVGLIDRRHGNTLSERYWQRLEAMLGFVAATMDCNGNVPMIGDADDARLVRLDPSTDASVYRSLLATGAVLFRRADFKARSGRFDDKSRWLLGAEGASVFEALPTSEESGGRHTFADGGYYLLAVDRGLPSEILCVADAGPLGYLSIAAHGHADALAITLSVAGRPVLIDPGTYAYHTDSHWRRYFRGTSAHNTARIDGLDQSEQGGNFLWLTRAGCTVHRWTPTDGEDRLIASHDGYRRLPDPVIHTRDIRLLKTERLVEVVDEFVCEGQHLIELHWHFSERCAVQVEGAGCVATVDQVRIDMTFNQPECELQMFRGAEELGWISHRFDQKQPSPTVRLTAPIDGPTKLVTKIRISG